MIALSLALVVLGGLALYGFLQWLAVAEHKQGLSDLRAKVEAMEARIPDGDAVAKLKVQVEALELGRAVRG